MSRLSRASVASELTTAHIVPCCGLGSWFFPDAFAPPRPSPSAMPATAVAPAATKIFPLILAPFCRDRSGRSVDVQLVQQGQRVVDRLEQVLVVLDHLAPHVDAKPLLVDVELV